MKPLFLLLVLTVGCYQLPDKPISLTESLPHIISVLPEEQEVPSSQGEFRLMISEPLDETTATSNAVFLLEGEVPSLILGDAKALSRSLEKNEIVSVSIRINLTDEGKTLSIQAENELKSETRYTLVVTPRLLSKGRLSINYFSKEYHTLSAGEIEGDFVGGESPEPDNAPPPPVPVPAGESPEDSSEIIQDEVAGGSVVINEIFYDAVGSDADGLLFIELFGTSGLDLSGCQILFLNGDNGQMTDTITLPTGAALGADRFYLVADARTGDPAATQIVGADLIDEFDPQNGPDAVQLVNPDGILLDAVGYGEGIVSVGENGLAGFESSPAPDVVSGHSLERVSPGQDTDNNAADFVERESPTPGR